MSGPALVRLCEEAGLEVQHELVADDRESIVAALKRLVDHEGVRFVFTTGGTGLTLDDVTPEATRAVIEREAPGYAEAIRMDAREHTPLGLLTRGVSGVRGRTLIVNLPGNPKAIEQSWPIIEPTLEHAAKLLERLAGWSPRPFSRSSCCADSRLPEPPRAPCPRARRGAFVNCTSEYWTTSTRFPHGSRKRRPRLGSISTPASSSARRTRVAVVHHEPEVARRRSGAPDRRPPRAPGTGRPCRGRPCRPTGRAAQVEDAAVEVHGLVDVAHRQGDVVDADHPGHGLSIGFRAVAAIELERLERRYGERVALGGVSVRVEEGQTLAVLGGNGAGKTTLLRVLAGLLRPHGGSARVLGAALPRRALEAARARSATSATSRSSTAS